MEKGLQTMLICYYEQQYRAATGRAKFKLNRSAHTYGYITRFYQILEAHYGTLASVGPGLIKSYLAHAFGKHAGRSFHDNKNVYTIGWILGRVTVLDFLQATRGRKWGMRQRLVERQIGPVQPYYEVVGSPSQKVKQRQEKAIFTAIPKYEEIERQRFLNSLRGYAWCAQVTTMHHPNSTTCSECNWSDKCKARQLLNYPAIHRLRTTAKP